MIHKLLSYIISYLYKINGFLLPIGFAMFIWFVWARFIRERLPKDIPFNLTEFGFYFIIYTCIIYLYIIICLLQPRKPNSLVAQIIEIIFFPLNTLDITIKQSKYISYFYYYKFLPFLIEYIYLLRTYTSIYICFNIIPRFLLVIILCIDTFCFHRLELLYSFILLGIFPLLYRYLNYSLKIAHKDYLTILSNTYDFIHVSDVDKLKFDWVYNSYLDRDEYVHIWKYNPDTMLYHDKYLTIEEYINLQSESYLDNDKNKICYKGTAFAKKEVYIEYGLNKYNNLTTDLTRKDFDTIEKPYSDFMPQLVRLNIFLEFYSDISISKNIKRYRLFIYGLYLLCWFFILISSIPYTTFFTITSSIISFFTIIIWFIIYLLTFTYQNITSYLTYYLKYIINFWTHFPYKNLPKEIPFNLNEFGFYLILIICLIYLYNIIILVWPNNTAFSMDKFIKPIVYPLSNLDIDNKFYKNISPFYYKFLNYFIDFIKSFDSKIFKRTYIWFNLVPRIFFVILLFIDIFYFHQLKLVYSYIFIILLPLFYSYIYYFLMFGCEDYFNSLNTNYLELNVTFLDTSRGIGQKFYDKTFTIVEYVNLKADAFVAEFYSYNDPFIFNDVTQSPTPQEKGAMDYSFNRYNGNISTIIQKDFYLLQKAYYDLMPKVLLVGDKLFIIDNISATLKFVYLRIFINILYFICWLYILITSLPQADFFPITEYIISFFIIFIWFILFLTKITLQYIYFLLISNAEYLSLSLKYIEPFSDTFL